MLGKHCHSPSPPTLSLFQHQGLAEDEVVGWYHQLNGHEFEQTPGGSEDRGAWRAAVHGVARRVRQNLTAEQQALSSTRNHTKRVFKRCSDHSHPCKSWPKFYARCHSWGVKGGSGKRRGDEGRYSSEIHPKRKENLTRGNAIAIWDN